MKEKINWIIEVVSNHYVCSACGGIKPQPKTKAGKVL